MKRKVVPLDKPVQVSRATVEVPRLGKREARVFRRPGSLSVVFEESAAAETAKVSPIRKPPKP